MKLPPAHISRRVLFLTAAGAMSSLLPTIGAASTSTTGATHVPHLGRLIDLYNKNFPADLTLLPRYANNDSSKFSFELVDAISFFVDLHQLTRQEKWIEKALDCCDYMIANCDEARFKRGDFRLDGTRPGVDHYWQAPWPFAIESKPVPGWSAANFVPPGMRLRVQILTDGQIIGAMSAVADYVLHNGDMVQIYRANHILDHCLRVIESHESSWREDVDVGNGKVVSGNWFYPERKAFEQEVYNAALPFNHSAGALRACLYLNKHRSMPQLKRKVDLFLKFTRNYRKNEDGVFKWPYTIMSPQRSEDFGHATYSCEFLLACHFEMPDLVSESELADYARSLMGAIVSRNPLVVNKLLDRSGDDLSAAEATMAGCVIDLAAFDIRFLDFAEELIGGNRIALRSYLKSYRSVGAILRFRNFSQL